MQPETGALVGAANWIHSLLSGDFAYSIAVLAVAGLGFALLTGRIAIRRAGEIIFGCFMLFGASSIASALTQRSVVQSIADPWLRSAPLQSVDARRVQHVDDPYAGASLVQN